MKYITNNKHDYTLGGLYGSSGAYIIEGLIESFDNIIIILNSLNTSHATTKNQAGWI